MRTLPAGWQLAQLNDLIGGDGLFTDGDWVVRKDQDPNGSIRLLQLADIGEGVFLNKSQKFINHSKFIELGCTEVKNGDVLVARMPEPLGRACILPKLSQKCITVVDVAIVRPGAEGILAKWLMHFINSPFVRDRIKSRSSGATRKRISRSSLGSIELPVPPKAEQVRIADKLDEYFARLKKCQEHLDRVQFNLKRFREAVLENAMSGRLTKDWEKDRSNIGEWKRVRLGELCHSVTDGTHQTPPQTESGIPFITISDISDGRLHLSRATRYVPNDYFERLKSTRKPEVGDVLFTVTGSIAIPVLVNVNEPFIFQRHIAILKPDHSLIRSDFLTYALATKNVKWQSQSVATGTAQLTIPLSGLRMIDIAFPSLKEQAEIVNRVETSFALADRLEARRLEIQTQVERVKPELLDKAFRGELVTQDPNDEPASALLERIRAARAKMAADIQKPRRRPAMKKKSDKEFKPIDIVQALGKAGKELSGKDLFITAGYPGDADSELIETFFVNIRDALRKNEITRIRRGNMDWFSLRG